MPRNKELEHARSARYRKRRREQLGTEGDRARARAASNKSAAKHRSEIRARRHNQRSRLAAIAKRLNPNPLAKESEEFKAAGFSVVTSHSVRNDLTWWAGPGAAKERQLDHIAEEWLDQHDPDRKKGVPPR